MQQYSVSLGGLETGYMQKLALYLSDRMQMTARVGVIEHPDESTCKDAGKTVWIGSKMFIDTLKKYGAADLMIVLTEEESDEEADEISIYRYQSCEKLYQKIMHQIQIRQCMPIEAFRSTKQKWIVMTTDAACASLLAFSITFSQLAGERSRVLYLNFSECSGMERMFLLENGMDLSDYVMALREGNRPLTDAFSGKMEHIDYILPASNPMILHELKEEDIMNLIQAIQTDERYDCIVIAMGNTCLGCQHIISRADRLIHLTDGIHHEYSRSEWIQFAGLCRGDRPIPVEQAVCPKFTYNERGIHLLYEWMEGEPGELARELIREGEHDIYERGLADNPDPADE